MVTDSASVLRAAFEETAAAGPARFTLQAAYAGSRASVDAARARNPLRRLIRLVLRRWFSGTAEFAGVVDLDRRRSLAWIEGAWGMLQDGDQVWSGRADRPLDASLKSEATVVIDPVGLIESVLDLRGARDDEPADGERRRLVASTDLGTVSVWLKDGRICEVRRDSAGDVTTLTLVAFGIDADTYDWTRLPGAEAP